MAKEVLTDAYFMINTVDLSDHVRSITLPLSIAEIEKTCMGDSSVARLGGLKDAAINVVFANDFAAAKVEPTLWAIFDGNAAVAAKIRKSGTDEISASNPEYQFNVLLQSYTPIDGAVGDLSESPVDFVSDGDVTHATGS